jgi:hypothetical protein
MCLALEHLSFMWEDPCCCECTLLLLLLLLLLSPQPGITYSDDKLLQTRIFSYADTQRHR